MNLPGLAARISAAATGAAMPGIGDSGTDRLANWAEKKFAPRFKRVVVVGQGSGINFAEVINNGETVTDGHDYASVVPISHPQIIGTPVAPTAGVAMGTSPPPPTYTAGSLDTMGSVLFGSGTSPPIGGVVCHIAYSAAFPRVPKILLLTENNNTAVFTFYADNQTVNGFDLTLSSSIAAGLQASRPAGYYQVGWYIWADPGGMMVGDSLHVQEIADGQFLILGKSRV